MEGYTPADDMKRRTHLLVLLALGLLSVGRADTSNDEVTTGFSLPPEPVLPAVERHPSLWFRPEQVEDLRAKREADPHARSVWAEIMASPHRLATLPDIPAVTDAKAVIHRYYGDLTQIAALNAFLFQLNPDGAAERYLATAKEALLRGYEGPLYQLDPLVKGSAVDEIYQAVWAQNLAAAYDWVQPALTAEEDAGIRAVLTEHAAYLFENLFSWADRPHNHLSKPAWGLGSLALALSGDERASVWLQRALEASNRNTRTYFGPDGIYREGTHYYTFSLINFLPFLIHYRNVSGVDGFGPFQPAFEWPLLIRNGKGWLPNQEDSYIRPFPSHWVAGAYRDRPTALHSSAPLASLLQWNFRNTDYGPFEAAERTSGFNYTGATWDFPISLIEFLRYEPGIEPIAPDVNPTVFHPSGQTVFRNDWSFQSPNHRYLLFQGVAEADNHQHFEHLSFILQAENQMMSSDAGYSRSSHGEAIRTDWYRTPEAHNVVMVDGHAPADPAVNRTPESRHRLVSPFFASELKAAPFAEGGEHRRLIAMLDGRRFAVVDQVDLPRTGRIAVVMHGGRAGLERRGNLHLWTYPEDNYGPAAALGQWFFGEDFRHQEKQGELTYIKGDFAAFPYFIMSRTGTEAFALSLLDPAPDVASIPDCAVDVLEGDRMAVQGSFGRILANRTGERWAQGGLESDGLLAVEFPEQGAELRLAMVDGRYLGLTGRLGITLSQPAAVALAVDQTTGAVTVHLSTDRAVEAEITVGGAGWKGGLRPGVQRIVPGD